MAAEIPFEHCIGVVVVPRFFEVMERTVTGNAMPRRTVVFWKDFHLQAAVRASVGLSWFVGSGRHDHFEDKFMVASRTDGQILVPLAH